MTVVEINENECYYSFKYVSISTVKYALTKETLLNEYGNRIERSATCVYTCRRGWLDGCILWNINSCWLFFAKSCFIYIYIYIYIYTGWNDKIVALEKTWFHFRLMKTGFLFLLQTIYELASCVQIPRAIWAFYHVWKWQCSTSEIGDAPLYNSCSLPIQIMTTGRLNIYMIW